MKFEFTTPAGPATAFDKVADFAALEDWDPFVKRSHLESGEAMTPGAVYRLDAPGGLTLRYRIVDVEAPRRIVYRGGTERVQSTDTIEFEQTDRGSRVTVTSQMTFQGRMRLLAPLIGLLVWTGGRLGSFPAMRRHLDIAG